MATTDNGITIIVLVGTILFWCQWRLGLEAPPSHCREHFDGAHNGNKIDAVVTTLTDSEAAAT